MRFRQLLTDFHFTFSQENQGSNNKNKHLLHQTMDLTMNNKIIFIKCLRTNLEALNYLIVYNIT